MGRESASLNSTIALLQERFKKLERVREMREERELHRSATTNRGAAQVGLQSSEQPKWLFPGASAPSSGQLRGSHVVVDTSLTIGSWHNGNETSDVDTSLHL
ncbi:hypothetical protein ZIOFF_053086 [Zingiber officinale]|uniref:Uncharacterized protein n=1 Tax=Zingiber officinale TaxID=94328 RepID=A0A8J5KLP7_ZINOF|nr:hypothetical protein ZIOFF_053086 [Zingiber officinale]